MYKVSFYDEEMVISYITGLLDSGLRSVNTLTELDRKTFFLEGRDIYIAIRG